MKIVLKRFSPVLFVWVFFLTVSQVAMAVDSKDPGLFSEEIEGIFSKKINELQLILQDPIILEAIRASNVEHQGWSADTISQLDKKFIGAKASDPWIQSFMNNAAAQRLAEYRKSHQGYAEIFVTDSRGLNVCQTNKTSDYYQADEEWWVKTFNQGIGKTRHGDIEFDESAQSQAVSLYAPILDGDSSKVIGVAKAVLKIDQIKDEL